MIDHVFGCMDEHTATAVEVAVERRGDKFKTTVQKDRFEKWMLDASSPDWLNSYGDRLFSLL